jgi:hypothetical protein
MYFSEGIIFLCLVDINATGNDCANTLVYDKSDPVITLAWKDTFIMDRYIYEYSCDIDGLRYTNGWHIKVNFTP